MPCPPSTITPAKVPKVAEAYRLSSSQNQKQNASATLSPAPKGRNIPAQGNALGNRPTTNPSPEGAAQGWPFIRLAEAGVISGGLTKNSKRDSNELQVSYLRVGNVYQNELRLDEIKTIGLTEREFEKTRLEKGDLLIVEGNGSKDQIGRLAIWDGSVEPCVHQNHLIRVRLSERVLPKFAVYWFSSQEGRAQIEHVASSTSGLYTLSVSKIGSLELPLPPLPEQRRIVARIEELFSRLDAGVAALRHAKAQLQRYRQSVLAAAVTGQLTQGTEYKSVLFKDLIDGLGQGWSPKCDLNRPPEADEWAVIKTTAIQSMQYDDSEAKPLPPNFEPRPNIEIRDGDFLMTRKGPRKRAGVACYVPKTRHRLMICDTVYRFRCRQDFVLPKYFELALNSPQVVQAIDRQKSGINESGVSLTHEKLGNVTIPLPPLAEQHQIVAEVEARTTAIDHLEAEIDRQITRSNRLRQSTLKSAVNGSLS
jgi:type I restriction enzyme S subunit